MTNMKHIYTSLRNYVRGAMTSLRQDVSQYVITPRRQYAITSIRHYAKTSIRVGTRQRAEAQASSASTRATIRRAIVQVLT